MSYRPAAWTRSAEWWSILEPPDAFHGLLTRFDEFQKSMGIAPNM